MADKLSKQEQFLKLQEELRADEQALYPKLLALMERSEVGAFFDELETLQTQTMPESPLHTTLRAAIQMRGYLKAVAQHNMPGPAVDAPLPA